MLSVLTSPPVGASDIDARYPVYIAVDRMGFELVNEFDRYSNSVADSNNWMLAYFCPSTLLNQTITDHCKPITNTQWDSLVTEIIF